MKKVLIISILLILLLSCREKEVQDRPNVVIILTDDQGWGDLSFNGNINVSTPNIDKLAREGLTLENFYVCPVSSPTRAELLTGRYHFRGGVYSTSAGGERLDLDEKTIADIFSEAGYATAAYGKWHNGTQAPYHPNARGFQDFYGFCSGHWGNYFDPILEHNGEIVKGNGFIIDDLTDHGIRFIEKNKDNNFFLYMPYNTPHAPMQVPENWWEKYENKELEMLYEGIGKENIQFTKAALAMCENIDWNVGRLVNKIEDLGLSEKTIIIYFSDNGPNSWRWNGGMKGRKGSTDEGGVKSPFFIKWKSRIKAGQKIKNIAGAIDLLPTLTELAGIKIDTPKQLDGISLKPILLSETSATEDRVIISHWWDDISVRTQNYRLDSDNNLYNIDTDQGQLHDISSEEPEFTNKLIAIKNNWEKEVMSELPEKDERPVPVGFPGYIYTQLPARDGIGHGNIVRSNRFPNCSFYTNWISLEDKITWDIEVAEDGEFEVELFYTCPVKDAGSQIEISFLDNKLNWKIDEGFNPPLKGMENDRVPREASYVKDFKRVPIGSIYLPKGNGLLTLKANSMPGKSVMDFRLLVFKRIQ